MLHAQDPENTQVNRAPRLKANAHDFMTYTHLGRSWLAWVGSIRAAPDDILLRVTK